MNLPESWKPLLLARADELCIPADAFQRACDMCPAHAGTKPGEPSHVWVLWKNKDTICYVPRYTKWYLVLIGFELREPPDWFEPWLPLS